MTGCCLGAGLHRCQKQRGAAGSRRLVSVASQIARAGFHDVQQICILSHLSRNQRAMPWRPSFAGAQTDGVAGHFLSLVSPLFPSQRACSAHGFTAPHLCGGFSAPPSPAWRSAVAALGFSSVSANGQLIIAALPLAPLASLPSVSY